MSIAKIYIYICIYELVQRNKNCNNLGATIISRSGQLAKFFPKRCIANDRSIDQSVSSYTLHLEIVCFASRGRKNLLTKLRTHSFCEEDATCVGNERKIRSEKKEAPVILQVDEPNDTAAENAKYF